MAVERRYIRVFGMRYHSLRSTFPDM